MVTDFSNEYSAILHEQQLHDLQTCLVVLYYTHLGVKAPNLILICHLDYDLNSKLQKMT